MVINLYEDQVIADDVVKSDYGQFLVQQTLMSWNSVEGEFEDVKLLAPNGWKSGPVVLTYAANRLRLVALSVYNFLDCCISNFYFSFSYFLFPISYFTN